VTPLAELLADRIRRFGPLTFADYMRECLYHRSTVITAKRSPCVSPTTTRASTCIPSLRVSWRGNSWRCGKPRRSGGIYACGAGAGVGRFAAHVLDFCEAKLSDFMVPCGTLRRAIRFETRTGKDRNEASRGRRAFHRFGRGSGAHRGQGAFFPMNLWMRCRCIGS